MMLKTMTTLVVLSFGLAGAPAGTLGGSGTEAFAVEWTSWTAFVESVSTPLALRLGAWLGGTLVLTILLSFVVRPLGRIRAFLGGTFGGVLAAAAFLGSVQRLEEMSAHLVAGGIVVMSTGLMLLRARARARKASGLAPVPQTPKSRPTPAPAPKPAAPAPAPTPKPDPKPASKPDPDPALSAPMPSIPPPDTEPVHKLPSDLAPEAKGVKTKRPPPPEPASAPAAEAPSPAPKAALKAKKKPSAPPAKPKATSTSSSGADWLQDHS